MGCVISVTSTPPILPLQPPWNPTPPLLKQLQSKNVRQVAMLARNALSARNFKISGLDGQFQLFISCILWSSPNLHKLAGHFIKYSTQLLSNISSQSANRKAVLAEEKRLGVFKEEIKVDSAIETRHLPPMFHTAPPPPPGCEPIRPLSLLWSIETWFLSCVHTRCYGDVVTAVWEWHTRLQLRDEVVSVVIMWYWKF